jgi:hypothetical protein
MPITIDLNHQTMSSRPRVLSSPSVKNRNRGPLYRLSSEGAGRSADGDPTCTAKLKMTDWVKLHDRYSDHGIAGY